MKGRFHSQTILRILFPLILAVYPFIHAAQGLDIADTTYALTGYTWLSLMDEMWLLATWLPNLLGSLLVHLPGGNTLAGLTVYCTFLQSAMGLTAWFVLGRLFGRRAETEHPDPAWLRFLMLFIAESLCWCPAVILYNYLTWLFVTLVSVFLLLAFHEDEQGTDHLRRARMYYFIAGVCAGLNLFVRFPNIIDAAFILTVWYHALLTGQKIKDSLRSAARITGICVLGYITAVIIPFVIISIRHGITAWPDMIHSLFSMTGGAEDYSAGGMLSAVAGAYLTTVSEMVPMLLVVLTGVLLFAAMNRWPALRGIAIFIYAFLLAFLFRLYYARGVFTRNYWYYDAMFELAMMLIVLSLVLDVLAVAGVLGISRLHRTAAFLSLLQILLLPLGSNNYTFPIVNCLFLILPLTGSLFFAAFRRLGDCGEKNTDHRILRRAASAAQFPLLALMVVLTLLTAYQGVRFHLQYTFGDGMDGRTRNTVISGIPRAAGTVTSDAKAAALQTLYEKCEALKKNGEQRRALIYGNAPGLHYLLDLPPVLFTAWPDLASNEASRIGAAIDALAASDEQPLVIFRQESLTPLTGIAADKEKMILDYIEKKHYNELFRVDGESDVVYVVYDIE